MWGHLSSFIQLVGVQELNHKPGEILGYLFTAQPSAGAGERKNVSSLLRYWVCFSTCQVLGSHLKVPGWVEEAGLRE